MTTIEVDESALLEEEPVETPAEPTYDKAFIEDLIDKLMVVTDELSGLFI